MDRRAARRERETCVMRLPIVGLLLAATGMSGCAPVMESREARCGRGVTFREVCWVRVSAPGTEGPGFAASTAQERVRARREETPAAQRRAASIPLRP
jgi:hypothetical protein